MMFARRFSVLLAIIIFSLGLFLFNSHLIFADDPTPTPDESNKVEELKKKEQEVQELQKKISELRDTEKTLSSQISIMNNQIKLTEARIYATKQEISNLILDIDTTTKKIEKLEEALQSLTEILIKRIVATYEAARVQPFMIVLSSNDTSSYLLRLNYLEIAQAYDKRLIFETQAAKNDYSNQKEIFEGKKKRVEALNLQLEEYNSQLAQERKGKQALLEVTKNDEKRYQDLLARALAEKSAIEGVIATIQLKDGQPIKAGEIIALIGNSGAPGCSSGPHLHLEFRKDGVHYNPADYLKERDVIFDNSPDGPFPFSGSWEWPIENPRITQGYGMTHWARIGWYGGGPHAGIDMTSDTNLAIRASKDGTLYKGSTTCRGATMNYVAVDHGEGVITWYWHVR